MKENLIRDRSLDFAIEIIGLYKILTEKKEYILSKQLLRSGTSIGANVEEALGGHSIKDFVARLIIAYKEARETKYWLRLLQRSQLVPNDYHKYINEIDQILNILAAIIKTSKKIRSNFLFNIQHSSNKYLHFIESKIFNS